MMYFLLNRMNCRLDQVLGSIGAIRHDVALLVRLLGKLYYPFSKTIGIQPYPSLSQGVRVMSPTSPPIFNPNSPFCLDYTFIGPCTWM